MAARRWSCGRWTAWGVFGVPRAGRCCCCRRRGRAEDVCASGRSEPWRGTQRVVAILVLGWCRLWSLATIATRTSSLNGAFIWPPLVVLAAHPSAQAPGPPRSTRSQPPQGRPLPGRARPSRPSPPQGRRPGRPALHGHPPKL